jgi:tetratricopeptide (TPR) repeat protein
MCAQTERPVCAGRSQILSAYVSGIWSGVVSVRFGDVYLKSLNFRLVSCMKAKSVATRETSRAKERTGKDRKTSVRSEHPVETLGEQTRPAYLSHTGLIVTGLVVMVAVCYANSLWNGFVFDDHVHVLDNISLRSLINVPGLVLSYRPLRDISYALDFFIWGEAQSQLMRIGIPFDIAAGFHFTNLVIHAANTVLVFLLARRILRRLPASVIAALIFAVHPIQTDAVTYVSGRRDVLFAFFYLVAFLFYLTYRELESRKYLALFLVAWGLSLASKEMGASLPFFIFIWSFCQIWPENEARWPRKFYSSVKGAFARDRWLYIGLAVAGLFYTFYQTFTKGGSERAGYYGFKYWGGSFYSNILTVIHVHAWFLKQLVYPTPITQYEGAFPISTSLLDRQVIVSALVVGSVLALGVFLLNRAPLMAFAILSYFALLLPVSQIIPHHELLADHYLYLPMMSFGIFAGLLIERIGARGPLVERIAWGATGVVIVIFAVLTVRQNGVWRDDYSLWQANYQAVPNSPRAVYSLAVEDISRNPRTAAQLFRRCIDLDPAYANAYMDLAALSANRDQARDIEDIIRKGLAVPDSKLSLEPSQTPGSFRSRLTTALAMARSSQGDHTGAEKLLWQAIALAPSNPQPYELLAGFYDKDPGRQQDVLKREVGAVPNATVAIERLTASLIKQSKYDDTIPYLSGMLKANPNDVYANFQFSQICRVRGDCARAWAYLKIAKSGATQPADVQDIAKGKQMIEQQCGKQ